MQGTLNLPWSTSTLVRMLPVAKKQPLPTTNVSGSVTCREQTRKLPNYKMCSSSLWLQDCVSVNACGHFEKKTEGIWIWSRWLHLQLQACYCEWKRNHVTPSSSSKSQTCKPMAHPCPKVAPHIRINAGTMEASASISDACSTMDIFKAAICALMLSNEYEQGGFTFGRTRQSTAVPPSCSTSK